jgi:hypothetical protein
MMTPDLLTENGTLRLQLATEKEITKNLTWAIEQQQRSGLFK